MEFIDEMIPYSLDYFLGINLGLDDFHEYSAEQMSKDR
jgi:hypothetical protein